ncbi:MAG: hypothetical protein CVU62_13370 [Deltaproteobacteria bacterium HGW-Deltaproteobacteria-2]|jgi:hypothetical protein|nr:MAG: hypothetical protein CVU62_13370 [Deltaproteobacteria bacterium HGW-Deltaproteobacteria-2]
MIKNYTSGVPVSRSVQHIEDCLIRHGAKNIMKMYDADKKLESLCFIMPVEGKDIPFKLPAAVDRVEKVLRASVRRPKAGTTERIKEQAERTAWKLQSDWVDIQMSLIELNQVEIMQVFLAYVYFPAQKQTYFDVIKNSGFKMLTEK